MAYPASKTTFSDPSGTSLLTSPDHASLHTSVNDTIESIQDTVGTTAGTNVLKDFAAGNFPARINSSNVLQQVISGTVNNSTLGTPTTTGGVTTSGTFNNGAIGTSAIVGGTVTATVGVLTGGNINTTNLGSPVVTVGSDAQGDIYYRNAGGSIARLGPGTSGQFLKTQGAAANPIWDTVIAISSKVITATRDISAASGTVGYTGVGFQPTSIIALANVDSTEIMGIGFSDSSGGNAGMEQAYTGTATHNASKLIGLTTASGAGQSGTIHSYTADGFIIGWTKSGADTGSIKIAFLCYR